MMKKSIDEINCLNFGKDQIEIPKTNKNFKFLTSSNNNLRKLSRAQLLEKIGFNNNSTNLCDLIESKRKILFVVPDSTRYVGVEKITAIIDEQIGLLNVDRKNISFIIGGGIHRLPSKKDVEFIFGKEIINKYKIHFHDANDSRNLSEIGITKRGTVVKVNSDLTKADCVIQIGGIAFHYIAGFSGGRKGILPGCGAESSIQQNHKLAFDKKTLTKSIGIASGNLQGNPVHEDMVEAVGFLDPKFSINTILNEKNEIVDIYAGNWYESHIDGCEDYLVNNTVLADEKLDMVIVSAGGFPKDINLIQSHKAMEHASILLKEGGTMIVVAKCEQGLGRDDFLDWFPSGGAKATAEKLLENYKVYGQTAWGIRWKTEKFRILLVSDLEDEVVKKMDMKPFKNLEDAIKYADKVKDAYVFPKALNLLPKIRMNE